ncbi:GNAT family N-acetyltransferase [Pseudoalteromonas sp. MMG024]|uniref:GNAT family N-acetyltransferase n=1 Tax=Pseudoalteromonas sp. MMG024 TaxID=2909980 RepID=UPI001F25E3F5|nr:GNAT family N-acetyltransferase [Pseudoalteromonas sp. MMG024]MCF6456082.1 GNAT family N-acetyltransferase [Pseudoalteromonas sp. MMG024]
MYTIEIGQLEQMVQIELAIPEFSSPKKLADIKLRLAGKRHLLLITYYNGEPIGYKLGYALNDTTFYSWLGAVVPEHRGQGLAQKMLLQQENWLQQHGFTAVQVKTMNRFRAMLAMLVKNNYAIIDLEKAPSFQDYKIRFEKLLG